MCLHYSLLLVLLEAVLLNRVLSSPNCCFECPNNTKKWMVQPGERRSIECPGIGIGQVPPHTFYLNDNIIDNSFPGYTHHTIAFTINWTPAHEGVVSCSINGGPRQPVRCVYIEVTGTARFKACNGSNSCTVSPQTVEEGHNITLNFDINYMYINEGCNSINITLHLEQPSSHGNALEVPEEDFHYDCSSKTKHVNVVLSQVNHTHQGKYTMYISKGTQDERSMSIHLNVDSSMSTQLLEVPTNYTPPKMASTSSYIDTALTFEAVTNKLLDPNNIILPVAIAIGTLAFIATGTMVALLIKKIMKCMVKKPDKNKNQTPNIDNLQLFDPTTTTSSRVEELKLIESDHKAETEVIVQPYKQLTVSNGLERSDQVNSKIWTTPDYATEASRAESLTETRCNTHQSQIKRTMEKESSTLAMVDLEYRNSNSTNTNTSTSHQPGYQFSLPDTGNSQQTKSQRVRFAAYPNACRQHEEVMPLDMPNHCHVCLIGQQRDNRNTCCYHSDSVSIVSVPGDGNMFDFSTKISPSLDI